MQSGISGAISWPRTARCWQRRKAASDGAETREYPYANLFAHVVGYSTRGNTGIEQLANYYLLTSSISPTEQLKNQVKDVKNQGDDVVTTLDIDLQRTAYDALGKNRGAVVVLEASDRTGTGYGVQARLRSGHYQ